MINIITLIILGLVSTMEIVQVYGGCQTGNDPIESCCCLGYNNTHFNAKGSGVYTIANFCGVNCSSTRAYCDTTSGGGGWLVIQRRDKRYSTSFHRDWTEYVDGFGNLYTEFWIGLSAMHCLTSKGNWEIRIDFTLANGTKSYIHYNHFKVGSAADDYPLSISGFIGILDISYAFNHVNRKKFTTRDRDNDEWRSGNCAYGLDPTRKAGGWWHFACSQVNFNFNYGARIYGFMYIRGEWETPSFVEMKIRPVNCQM